MCHFPKIIKLSLENRRMIVIYLKHIIFGAYEIKKCGFEQWSLI